MVRNKKYSRKPKRVSHNQTRKKMEKKTMPIVYGKIYAKWCGHCNAMEKDWHFVKQKIGFKKSFDIEQKQESEMFPKFKEKYGTDLHIDKGYPTIYKLYEKGGNIEFYEGPRTFKDMLHWVQHKENKPKPKGFFSNLFLNNS
jgi:thiol-disulfide isomerase/thioredoxin